MDARTKKTKMKVIDMQSNGNFILQIGEDEDCLKMSFHNDSTLPPEIKSVLDQYILSKQFLNEIQLNISTNIITKEIKHDPTQKDKALSSSEASKPNILAEYERSLSSAKQILMQSPLYVPPVLVINDSENVRISPKQK
jgi:hypothetical protein